MQRNDYTKANQRAWNESAVHHTSGDSWNGLLKNFASPGFSTLDATLTNALVEIGVDGKSVVQIACNNGRDVLSTCALGAKACAGIDISESFIEAAERINNVARRDCEFMVADIYALPKTLRRDFDVALITIGVLNWMPDPDAFFATVRGLLKPGGALVIYETHPFLDMFDPRAEKAREPAYSYFPAEPFRQTEAIVYDGADVPDVSPSYWFAHSLGTVVTACIESGFRLSTLKEFPHSIREVDFDRYENEEPQLPMCYLLTAVAA